MKLREINKTEFFNFCKNHSTNNFYQSKQWAEYERKKGWHTFFLGVDQNGKIKAATMILSKNLPIIKKRFFYAPGGYIINFKDIELLRFFTKELKTYIKDKNGIFLKITPYMPLKNLDKNGEYIQGGYDNGKCVDILKELGYTQIKSNYIRPIKQYKIDLKNNSIEDIFNNMDDIVKENIITNERKAIYITDVEKNDISKVFNTIIKDNNGINFINDDLSDFYQIMEKDNLLKIKLMQMDVDKYINNASSEDEKKEALELQYNYGHKIIIGCNISICYGNEVTTICSSINDKFKNFLSQYNLNYEIIKWAKDNNYETYNFGYINDNNYYEYCKGFNGNVVETLGEFDLVINNLFYNIYNRYLIKTKKVKNILKDN